MTEPRLPQDADASDEALARVLAGGDGLVSLEELARVTGLSLPVLQTVAREGLLVARATDPPRYAVEDAALVRTALDLVEAGLPLGEFLDLARRTDEAMRPLADHAVDLFVRFVRDPVLGTSGDDQEAAARLVAAFETMLPATQELVGRHFRELLLVAARERWERETGAGG